MTSRSSFTFISILVCLLAVCVFNSPSYARTEGYYEHSHICSRTSHYRLCLKLLRSHSRTYTSDPRELTKVSLDLALSKARRIHFKLNSDSKYRSNHGGRSGEYTWGDRDAQRDDRFTWGVRSDGLGDTDARRDDRFTWGVRSDGLGDKYSSCSKNYNDAIHALELAKRLLDSGDYTRIPVQVRDALEEVRNCRSQIKRLTEGYGSLHLSKLHLQFEVLCDVAKFASESLSGYKDSYPYHTNEEPYSSYPYEDWYNYGRGNGYDNYRDWYNDMKTKGIKTRKEWISYKKGKGF